MIRTSFISLLIVMLLVPMVHAEDWHQGLTLAQLQEKDWFYEGRNAAKHDYTGAGATAGGFLAGVSLGIIGWGVGYVIMSNSEVIVPRRYTADMTTGQRGRFEDGYAGYVKKKRSGNFSMGAGLGTVLVVVLFLASSSQ